MPSWLQAEGDVLFDRHMREQRIGLEHHVDGPAIGRRAGKVLAVEDDFARRRLLEARQHAQQRGLAAAGGAEQREEFAVVDIEREVVDGDEIAELLGDVLEGNDTALPKDPSKEQRNAGYCRETSSSIPE